MNPPEPAADATIRRVLPEQYADAVTRLSMGGVRPTSGGARRFVAGADRDGTSLQHIWAAPDGDDPLGDVAMLLPQPGRTAMLFVSHPTTDARVARLAVVVDAACAALDAQQITLVQALLELNEHRERAALQHAGFESLASLTYMQHRVSRHAPAPALPRDARCVPWDEQRRAAFEQALRSSYEQTQDCPTLRGLRRTSDVLEGHRAAGRFEPHWWTLMLIDDAPAALMLLAPLEESATVELVYLGVAAPFRQRGLAQWLLEYGMHQCAQSGARTLTLAVDESNSPAIRLYQSAGFRATARRWALMRVLSRPSDEEC